jgi:hypothetical protein
LTLTSGVPRHLRDGFLIFELPITFQDAVAIRREFQVHYLWIDSISASSRGPKLIGNLRQQVCTKVCGHSACKMSTTGAADNDMWLLEVMYAPLNETA